ncbi:MAG: penicillin acylase family protein [Ardenticatenaceae bacterium]|nr:penicillin acylase family protein [Ardenticatenaceae bacterium]
MADRLKTIVQRWSRQRLPQLNGRIYLPSLQATVTIRRDQWGVPHIHAQTRHDLYLAQGFVHAQDRLWQMELNRRAATGTLSAVFGAMTLDTDRFSRTFGFARLARATLDSLSDEARQDLTAYTAGVNSFLASQPVLPIEFAIVQHRPEPWELLDSLAYAHLQMWALTHGAFGELVKAQLLQQVDEAVVQDLLLTYPEQFPATLPDGIEENAQWIDAWQGTAVPWQNPFLGKGNLEGAGRGSNGWVIAPDHSTSGGAILCNDMHLPIGTPSIWHFQHLRSDDGLHVVGFTQPSLPYVMVGHNGRISWGATLAYTDCEDLFIEKLHPDDATQYQFGDTWRQAEIFEEVIEVRFQKPHQETVTCTHHGPLIHKLMANEPQPLAYNSTALRGGCTIDGFAWLNAAENWDEFVTAVAHIHAPSLNLLYADRQGNIGHWVSGQVPLRASGDGTVPTPGWTGDNEWTGIVPFDEMPHALNPKSGYIISANNRLLPAANTSHNLGQLWRNGYRAERIRQLLHGQPQHSQDDCRRHMIDQLSLPGLEMVQLLQTIPTPADLPPESQAALTWLRQWDGRLTIESVGGALFEVLVEQLTDALLPEKVPAELLPSLLGQGTSENLHPVNEFQGYWLVNLLRILQEGPSPWFPDLATRNKLILDCLGKSTAVLQQTLGDDPANWQWGQLHQVTFQHALGRVSTLEPIFNIGPFPMPGDGNTVAQSGMRPGGFACCGISVSSRLIVDMSAIEKAEAILAPGQSGHVGSPHYRDLAPMWLAGENFPILWQENDVIAATKQLLTLTKRL